MFKERVYGTLVNRAGLATLWWATLQQLVVASSTYFIIAAIRAATAGDFATSVTYALWFTASLVVVFVPNTLSVMALQRWRFESLGRFVQTFVRLNAGRATFAHGRDKRAHESWLTNESGVVYENGLRVLYDMYQILLSTILNLCVIAFAIDVRISVFYVGAGVLLAITNHVFRARISTAALATQTSRREFANVLLMAWENIFVGNRHNLDTWQARFANRLGEARESAIKLEATRTLVSSAAITLALIVIAIGNGLVLREQRTDVTALAALLVTLPRQLQVVQNLFGFFSYWLSWQGVRTQFGELENAWHLTAEPRDVRKYIQLDAMSIAGEAPASLEAIAADLRGRSHGRLTIRGKNGAGKSTLLSWLAESFAGSCFFLPSQYVNLAFDNEGIVSLSDGNRILGVFAEIPRLKDVRVVLLDEWDANLDSENIKLVDAAIDRLAADRVVLESRHRS